jgi:hypothetical protein
MRDVTALVLSLGEDFLERAIASVRRQTLPAAEIVVVHGLSPFHRALNSGASRVHTEYFIQVDADMILDDTCIADLRAGMSDGVGMVIGHLRDPLLGRLVGIKLFRTRCFEQVRHPDSVSSETDFAEDIERQGWARLYALKYTGKWPVGLHTFGEHCPDYDPCYTFCKFLREGAKARYRKAWSGLRRKFRQLHASGHGAATIAAIAAAHGIFVKEDRDFHGPSARSEEFDFLERFLHAPALAKAAPVVQGDLRQRDLSQGFKRAYALGIRLRRQQAPAAFIACMRRLQRTDDIASWVALVGLCQGLFVDEYREAEAAEALALLGGLLHGPQDPEPSYLGRLGTWLRSGGRPRRQRDA